MKSLSLVFHSLAIALLAVSVGCSSGGLPSDAAAVTGKVTHDGQAVANAVVTFLSDSGYAAVGKTNEEGVYQLSSAEIPGGTKPGSYKVMVSKIEQTGGPALTEEDPGYDPKNPSAGGPQTKHLLPQKYSKISSSGLTADVKAGENTVDLPLDAK